MKRRAGRLLISCSVLLLIGISLFFWENYPKYNEKSRVEQIKTWEQLVEEEAAKKAETKKLWDSQEQADSIPEQNSQTNGEDLQEDQGGTQGNSKQAQQPEETVIVFAGDIYISPYVEENYKSAGINGVVSQQLLEEMKHADIAMANQEFPFSTAGTKAPDKQFTFRVDPLYTSILKELGIDTVTLANNHALDYGAEALTDTFEALNGAEIAYIGAGEDRERAMQPWNIESGQRSYGFLAASRVIPVIDWNVENQQPGIFCTYDSQLLCKAIKEAKQNCDFLTVYVHWGVEKDHIPQDYQRQLAEDYIDAGVDLVVGAHPHVLQGIEFYRGKPIVYSLGNFIFNQEIASTVLLKVKVSQDNQSIVQLIPASASGAKTQEMSGDKAKELYQYMESISNGIAILDDGTVVQR